MAAVVQPGGERDRDRDEQEADQRIAELHARALPPAQRWRGAQDVGAVDREAARRLCRRQAGGTVAAEGLRDDVGVDERRVGDCSAHGIAPADV
jgi:hypothetical protein